MIFCVCSTSSWADWLGWYSGHFISKIYFCCQVRDIALHWHWYLSYASHISHKACIISIIWLSNKTVSKLMVKKRIICSKLLSKYIMLHLETFKYFLVWHISIWSDLLAWDFYFTLWWTSDCDLSNFIWYPPTSTGLNNTDCVLNAPIHQHHYLVF